MKNKIYFVDSWSVGFQIIEPIIQALNKNEYDLYFVHFDSLIEKYPDKLFTSNIVKSNKYLNNSQIAKGIDLGKFNYSVVDFFNIEKPDLLIFISIHNLEQRYFLNVAKYFNIKTMLIMHGVILNQGIINNKSILKKLLYPITKFNRLRYYTTLFKIYNNDLKKNKPHKFSLRLYLKILIFREKYVNRIQNSESFVIDSICMTSLSDKTFYSKYYKQNESNTEYKLVGHLDNHRLINYYNNNKEELISLKNDCSIFFSQPLINDGTLSESEFFTAIKSIKTACDEVGLKFIVRPHPRDDKNVIYKIENDFNIEISNKSLEEDLFRARIVLGINSTALLSANFINKNIIIIDFGFANQFAAISPEQHKNVKIIKFNDALNIKLVIKTFNKQVKPLTEDTLKFKDPVKLITKEIDVLLNGA